MPKGISYQVGNFRALRQDQLETCGASEDGIMEGPFETGLKTDHMDMIKFVDGQGHSWLCLSLNICCYLRYSCYPCHT